MALHLGTRRPDLILAGHTHGGQVRLPLVGALVTHSRLPRRLAMGLHRYRGVPLFVSRGVGYSRLNLWLHCPAEVALLTLRATVAIRGLSIQRAHNAALQRLHRAGRDRAAV